MPLFVVFAMIGLGSGWISFRKYSNIINSVHPIPIVSVVKLSALMAVAACFVFTALITIGGSLAENKQEWNIQELFGVLAISFFVGLVVFLGSMYQIYTTIKYRDLLIKRNIIKK
jgi:hypothetical protein